MSNSRKVLRTGGIPKSRFGCAFSSCVLANNSGQENRYSLIYSREIGWPIIYTLCSLDRIVDLTI